MECRSDIMIGGHCIRSFLAPYLPRAAPPPHHPPLLIKINIPLQLSFTWDLYALPSALHCSQELMLKKKMLGRGGGGADRMRDRNIEPDCE